MYNNYNQMAEEEVAAIKVAGEEILLAENGDPLDAGSVVRYIDVEEVFNDNDATTQQLEIEFPAGEVIYQLQSPGGSTCIMEGVLMRTNAAVAGFQVVRVITGEKGEKTIFLVPSIDDTGDKDVDMDVDDVQQEMVVQSDDDKVEKETAELPGGMVKEETEVTEVNNSPPKPVPVSMMVEQQMGVAATAKSHERPKKRNAAKTKAVVIVSPKKLRPRKKPATMKAKAKPKNKVKEVVVATGPVPLPKINIALPTETPSSSVAAITATFQKAKHMIRKTSTPKPNDALGGTSNSTTVTISTATLPPPPPIFTASTSGVVPPTTSSQGAAQSLSLLPEDVVSESDDDENTNAQRKCVVCLSRQRFTEDIFETNKDKLLQHMHDLFSQLNVPIYTSGNTSEEGVCTFCLDQLHQLQRSHIFTSVIKKRHQTLQSSGAVFDDSPIRTDEIETQVYKNFKKMTKVKEVYQSATHLHLTRRIFTDKDWDFFCNRYKKPMNSAKAKELERYIMCREKLTHIYCVKCQRLVKNGKKGFVKHMKTQHPHAPVMFPCDICGNHFPDKDMTSTVEEYYRHWISHFYSISCGICGKRFLSKRGLGQHNSSVHKNGPGQLNSKSKSQVIEVTPEDRSSSEKKETQASDHHRGVNRSNLKLKNHMCKICGETFRTSNSLLNHVRRHDGRKDFKCEVCHKEYYTYTALKGHKAVHQTARDFICGICGKAFKKNKALEEHGTLHTGVKPHICPICGREIRVKSNLYKHMKIHKKNAELGITNGKGRAQHQNSSPPVVNYVSGSTCASSSSVTTPTASSSSSSAKSTQNKRSLMSVVKEEGPKIKQIKVEDRIIEVKQEPVIITHLPFDSVKMASNGNVTSSPVQSVKAVLENAELVGGEHRGPIIVSIVTEIDDPKFNGDRIRQMNPEQQAQFLSGVTSLANSQGPNITVRVEAAPTTAILASSLQSTPTTGGAPISNAVAPSSFTINHQDPIGGELQWLC